MNTKEKMKILYTPDEVACLTEEGNDIYVNLHGMSAEYAIRYVRNVINLTRNSAHITLIHGYNHGTTLLEIFRNSFDSKRIKQKECVKGNMGRTVLLLNEE